MQCDAENNIKRLAPETKDSPVSVRLSLVWFNRDRPDIIDNTNVLSPLYNEFMHAKRWSLQILCGG